MKAILPMALVVLFGCVATARAGPEWVEPGDAGSDPDSAQRPTGTGTLMTIQGKLDGLEPLHANPGVQDYEDMYLIRIDGPVAFSATTVEVFGGSAEFDTRLYLFAVDGFGLLGNDDTFIPGLGEGEVSTGSTLENAATDGTGVVITEPGLYFLAITVSPRDPVSSGGPIFSFESSGPEGPPGGPAGDPPTCDGDATNLLYPLDGSFVLVDFFGDGPTGSGPAQGPDQHNDDDSATVPLPFSFDLYGDLHTQCFVNNNGNLSFGLPFSTFTAEGFPVSGFPMIAPFWGDVDTGNPSNFVGDVWMKFVDSNGDEADDTLVVTWDNVGYFNEHGDLRNTFQVAISDGTNPLIGLGNNVCFSYDNMCWTTGDASGGVGGFGGVPATVGANRGDGVDFFQIGRFDHEGTDYDGPFGNNDGVSFLDGQVTCFNTSTTTSNIPPIPTNFPPGNLITIDAGFGEVLDLDLQFLSPEEGQTTTVTINDVDGAQAAGLTIVNTPGNVATVALDWVPDIADHGTYVLQFTATDDFDPPGITMISLTIGVVSTEVSGPDGPGGGEPIIGWEVEDQLPPVPGQYIIFLSGVSYPGVPLDIKPGSCPNLFNRGSHGVLPVAVVGTDSFDPMDVDLSTVVLTRADGVGGNVSPNEGPPGPHTTLGDSATPFAGNERCDCHELEGDDITDLNIKFKTDDVVAALQLNALLAGDLVELVVTGNLLDGTPFSGLDCVRLVPPGTPPGMLAVGSNLPGAWLDVSPLDLQLDGGGFANFQRTFPLTTVVTLTAPAAFHGWVFSGWLTDGGLRPGQSIHLTIREDLYQIEAIYRPAGLDALHEH
ncbi:MAG: hypothetical protein IH830_11200 [Planctomycetes bacterium]|nr:hypothetical protein [Planctomycetota bacterium]